MFYFESLLHGSMLYSSSHVYSSLWWIFLLLVCSHDEGSFGYESKVLMYCRSQVDDDLRSRDFLPRSDNLLLQRSHISYPSSSMILGEFCYTQFLSPPCTKNQNIRISLKSSKYEVRYWSGLIILHLCPPPLFPYAMCVTLVSNTIFNWQWAAPPPNPFDK